MKLITRCPQCQTSFRVHDHQLAVRQGRVRCGACGNVFDAYSTLVEVLEDTVSPEASDAPAARTDRLEQQSPTNVARQYPPTLPGPEHGDAGYNLAYDPAAVESVGEPVAEDAGRPVEAFQAKARPDQLAHADVNRPRTDSSVASDVHVSMPSYSIADPPAHLVPIPDREEDRSDALDEHFDFGPRRATRRARIALGIGSTLLALALMGQAIYASRSYIAGWAPATRPALTAACGWIGCDVPLPRQADQLFIESSDLRAEANPWTLTAIIRNQAVYDQALPVLLLEFTDGQEKPIARRIIEPATYLGKPPGADAVFAAGSTINATVYVDATDLGAVGYELQVLYR